MHWLRSSRQARKFDLRIKIIPVYFGFSGDMPWRNLKSKVDNVNPYRRYLQSWHFSIKRCIEAKERSGTVGKKSIPDCRMDMRLQPAIVLQRSVRHVVGSAPHWDERPTSVHPPITLILSLPPRDRLGVQAFVQTSSFGVHHVLLPIFGLSGSTWDWDEDSWSVAGKLFEACLELGKVPQLLLFDVPQRLSHDDAPMHQKLGPKKLVSSPQVWCAVTRQDS
ncbi:hypothetical protein KCU88_g164, partial [Aureobasidium melanogenum]